MKIDENVLAILKPFKCETCEMRFPDDLTLQAHKKCAHSSRGVTRPPVNIDPKTMNMKALKEELRARGASLSGDKSLLVRRLEGILASEIC